MPPPDFPWTPRIPRPRSTAAVAIAPARGLRRPPASFPATLASGSMFGYCGQALRRAAVARLDRQGDVEAQLVSDPGGRGRTAGPSAGPGRPRAPTPATAAVVAGSAQMRHRGRRAAEPFGGKRGGKHGVVVERQLLVGQPPEPAPTDGSSPAGLLVRCALPRRPARTVPRPPRRTSRASVRAWAAARSTSFRTGPTRRASPRPVGERRSATADSSHPSFSTPCVHAAARPRSPGRCARRVRRSSSNASLKPVYPASAISSHRRRYSGIPAV